MKDQQNQRRTPTALLVAALAFVAVPAFADEHEAMMTHDGLVEVPNARVGAAYVDPDANFAAYNKIMMLDALVAFRKNWERDMQKTGSRIRISSI